MKHLKINEAMDAASDEYDAECRNSALSLIVSQTILDEYEEIDKSLPKYVGEIAGRMGFPDQTEVPAYIYIIARMCFRLGMRAQRKIDNPDKPTSIMWREMSKDGGTRQ